MKSTSVYRRLLAALLTLVLSAASVAYAAAIPQKVDARILNHFAKTFKSAENVTWMQTEDYSKATFTRKNQHMEVFYNERDELVCTVSYIGLNELPDATQELIKSKYDDYRPASAIKYVDASGMLKYYVELESNRRDVILQTGPDGITSVFKNTKR